VRLPSASLLLLCTNSLLTMQCDTNCVVVTAEGNWKPKTPGTNRESVG
jgi:hypothetical protein